VCGKCGLEYSDKHSDLTCKKYKKYVETNDKDAVLFNDLVERDTEIKNCPNCNVVIEKNMGCRHMVCFNCDTNFCWMCLKVKCICR
jgi:hypothetical protein